MAESARIHGKVSRRRGGMGEFMPEFSRKGDQNKKNRGIPSKESPGLAWLNHASKLMSDYFPRLARFQTIKPKPILLTASPML